ncbi:MAG TPA: hypothetical protein VN442_07715 [Bryobacteraceae bacterium]|nr:hypothetical protein [Bryobacteraceae bacterium]
MTTAQEKADRVRRAAMDVRDELRSLALTLSSKIGTREDQPILVRCAWEATGTCLSVLNGALEE